MKRTHTFLLGAALIALGSTGAFAEGEFKNRTVGDWTAIENAWRHRDQLGSQEITQWAWTEAASQKALL